jgi:small neutral amino acid transporter SnatA (MarC family)
MLLAYLAAVNPPRLRPHLAGGAERGDPRQLAAGAAIVGGAGSILVLAANEILDALAITDETWRLAAGVVCALVGARVLVAPRLREMPLVTDSVFVPIAFPLLFTPQLAMLAILFGSTESFAPALGWLAAGIAAGVAVGGLRHSRPELWLAAARLFAAALVAVGIALVIAGIRDV